MNVGDTIEIDTGSAVETRKIASVGTAAGAPPVLSDLGWKPYGRSWWQYDNLATSSEGPVINLPVGTTTIPVHNVTNFEVGQKIAIGYGASGPAVASGLERYEVLTVTAVGKAGAQTLLAADAKAGDTAIRVRNAASISVGDKIRLDIDSVGHGIETVTVKSVSAPAGGGGAMPGRGGGALGPALDGDS